MCKYFFFTHAFIERDSDWIQLKAKYEFQRPFVHIKKNQPSKLAKNQATGEQKNTIATLDPTKYSNNALHANENKSTALKQFKLNLPTSLPLKQKPKLHAPWKLYRVISGHYGWVRCIALDPLNKFFVTGSSDRMLKVWDLASGALKLSLTGHVHTVRGVVLSARHPYMFSCGEDNQVKCWDLECNKVLII